MGSRQARIPILHQRQSGLEPWRSRTAVHLARQRERVCGSFAKKTSISLFRINAEDRDRQGWHKEAPDRSDGTALPCLRDGISPSLNAGGERGIRTPDTRKGIHAFEARAFSHSAISPRPLVSFSFYQGSCWLRISPPISLN